MNKSNNKRSIFLSVTALLIVFVLVVGVSFSWSEGGSRGYVNSPEITISSGSQLTILADADSEGRIKIPTENLKLAEVSSADGRNFFFPTISNTSSTTSDMFFREGIPADENTKYLSFDFDIEGGDTNTNVYLGAGTVVQCNNKDVMSALRIALFANDGSNPYAIFRPNQMANVSDSYSPIATLTADFKAELVDNAVTTMPFGDYYFGNAKNQSLFTIKSGEIKHLTVAMWLEGTAFDGEYDDFKDVKVKLNLDFTTESDLLTKYNFIDNTHGYNDGNMESWITNTDTRYNVEYPTMMYVYDKDQDRYYAMTQNTNYHTNGNTELSSWSIYLPDNIKDFTFRRYSVDIDNWWNEWNPSMTDIKTDQNGEHTFVAICGNTKDEEIENKGCYGYWKDEYGTFRIYFEMQTPYNNLHCYAWDTSGKACASTGTWPGTGMEFVKNTSNGVLYSIDLKESDNIAGIQFNNGGVTRVYLNNFGYEGNTSAYAYLYENNQTIKLNGDWPGAYATYDANNSIGNYWIDFTQSISRHGHEFYVIANNRNGAQFPSGDDTKGLIGRVYRFTNNNKTLEELARPYDISGDEFKNYIFNGSVFWLTSDGSHGFYIHTGSEHTLIYPQNVS